MLRGREVEYILYTYIIDCIVIARAYVRVRLCIGISEGSRSIRRRWVVEGQWVSAGSAAAVVAAVAGATATAKERRQQQRRRRQCYSRVTRRGVL